MRLPAVLGVTVTALAVVASPASPASLVPCDGRLSHDVIPAWSRTGFSEPAPRMAHVVGRRGKIVALVFGDPLASPPARDHANKILWVERRPSTTPTALWIRAQRMVGTRAVGRPVTRVVAHAPGPSIVNLPEPGCWRLQLSWSGRHDSLDLRYRAGA